MTRLPNREGGLPGCTWMYTGIAEASLTCILSICYICRELMLLFLNNTIFLFWSSNIPESDFYQYKEVI
ncbi:hypothetical protein AFLA_013039 [Aspergillus flavus NRRL3357]|nr:hypothetical protein AFLA_013039 [Aspergillus flavus NRRL3357]